MENYYEKPVLDSKLKKKEDKKNQLEIEIYFVLLSFPVNKKMENALISSLLGLHYLLQQQ